MFKAAIRLGNWNILASKFVLSRAHCLVFFLIPFEILGLNSILRSHSKSVCFRLQESRNFGKTIQTESIPYLTSDAPIRQKIASGKSHLYRIELTSGQFFQVYLETLDTRISMSLINPDHRKIYEVNSRRFKPTSLSLIAEVSGVYTIELQSRELDEDASTYELRHSPLRKATLSDRDSIAAEKSFSAAIELRAEWTSGALLKAVNKYKVAYNYWYGVNNRRQLIEVLTNIGEAYSTLSQNLRALDYYNQALLLSRALKDQRSEVDLLNVIGEINVDLGNRQITLDYCKQALALSIEVGYISGQAQALNNLGLAYLVLSDMQKALDSLNQALNLWRASGDRRGQAQTLTNMGYSYNDLGDLRKALATFDEALVLWQKSRQLRGETLTLTAIGLLYSSLGDMQRALDTQDKALKLFRKMGNKSGEAVTLNAMAYVYDTLGNKNRALDCYKKALHLYRSIGRRSSEAVTLGLIGEIYDSLGDRQKALDYYKQNLEISRSLGDQRAESYALKDIGDIFVYFGEKDKAISYLNRALTLSQSLSDPRGQANALNSLGYVYEMSGQKQKALDYYKQSVVLNRATEDRAGEVQTLHNIVRVGRDLGNYKDAYEQSKAMLDIVETLRTKVASQELQSSYFASAHQHYELYIDVLMRLHKQNPEAGYAAAALEASEKSRGRVLLDLLSEAHADVRQGVEPALLQEERDLQQLLNAKAGRQLRLLSDAHTEEQAALIKKEVEDLTTQYEEVLAQIRATSGRYANLTQPRTLNLSEIQKQLFDPDTMLLEYSLGEERSYLWAVTSASAIAYELPARSKIEGAAIRMYRSLTEYGEHLGKESSQQKLRALEESNSQYSRAAIELTDMLLGPIAPHLATKRLVIVADGALQYVPFAALPDPNDIKRGKQERQPLVVDHEIINLPSVSILSALRSEIQGRSSAPKALAVFADPVFEKGDPRVNLKGRTGRGEVNSASATTRGQHELRAEDLLEV